MKEVERIRLAEFDLFGMHRHEELMMTRKNRVASLNLDLLDPAPPFCAWISLLGLFSQGRLIGNEIGIERAWMSVEDDQSETLN